MFTWTPVCSMTAVKYQRYDCVEMKPFMPGEKKRSRMGMERSMKGYKEMRQELDLVRKTIDKQEKARQENARLEKRVQTSFYKSPVGTRCVASTNTHKHYLTIFSGPPSHLEQFSSQNQWLGWASSPVLREFERFGTYAMISLF